MKTFALSLVASAVYLTGASSASADGEVANIQAASRHGQTFVTWKDVVEGAAGAKYRYSLYRSEQPITEENLAKAELCYYGILNNSARLYGAGWGQEQRQDPTGPTCIIEEGGKPLPQFSGVAVHTVRKDGSAFYAIVATDEKFKPLCKVIPGQSATTKPVAEKVAPIQPIKQVDSKDCKGPNANRTAISGQMNLPLHCEFHGSNAAGAPPDDYGDFWIYYGTPAMGYRDGIVNSFFVREGRDTKGQRSLHLKLRDSIEHPVTSGAFETKWFGYLCVPQGATHKEPRLYRFTERRLLWILDWVRDRYQADPLRVYTRGTSMGGRAATQFSFMRPEIFAAVYPLASRMRNFMVPEFDTAAPSTNKGKTPIRRVLLEDGKTDFLEFSDMVRFAQEHPADLPFMGWGYGRRDRIERWQCHLDMAKALADAKHGFAFAWNDGNHGNQGPAMQTILKYYPPERFARNLSYPAFRNSSIDNDPGQDVNGVPEGGEKEGGINLGFDWKDPVDQAGKWSVQIGNVLARGEMTVDVTPRRCQQFKLTPGEKMKWTTSTGDSGEATADAYGLVTVAKVKIQPGKQTTVTISR